MKIIHELIGLLKAIETRMTRRKAVNRAARVAVRMALNGCRV